MNLVSLQLNLIKLRFIHTYAPCSALPLGELFVNQFLYEALITCKELLAQVALRVGGAGADVRAWPEWLPLMYNLVYELPQMVKECYQRQER